MILATVFTVVLLCTRGNQREALGAKRNPGMTGVNEIDPPFSRGQAIYAVMVQIVRLPRIESWRNCWKFQAVETLDGQRHLTLDDISDGSG